MKRSLIETAMVTATLLGATVAFGGQLSLARVQARPGDQVSVPVIYRERTGRRAVGLATDVTFDPAVLKNPRCAPGTALENSAKVVTCAEVAPGKLRVGILGLDLAPIEQGEVAQLTFELAADARPKYLRLRHVPTGADAKGRDYSLRKRDGIVRVRSVK